MLIVEPQGDLPLVSISVSFFGGAAVDPIPGLARLTCRMLRRGCTTSDGGVLDRAAIEERVDALGGELASHVGLGSSSIGCDVLSRSADELVDLLASLLARPTFAEAELAKLVRTSQAELVRARDDDSTLVSRAVRKQLFGEHPHGRRIAGSTASLGAISVADAKSFYDRHYTRDNAVVAICGDVTEARAEAMAERLLAGLPSGERVALPAADPEPPAGRGLVIVDKPDRSQSQTAIATLGTHPRDDDHMALLVANVALGGSFTSRLTQEVRAKRGWSYNASSVAMTGRVREMFALWTAPAAEDTADCLALELALLEDWVEQGITSEELDFCKQYLMRSYPFEVDTPRKRLQQKLEEVLLDLPDRYHADYVDNVAAVSVAQANEAIARRIDPSRLWIAVVGDAAELGPEVREAVGPLGADVVLPFDHE